MRKQLFSVLVLTLLSSIGLAAAEPKVTVDTVLDRFLKEVGGKAAVEGIKSLKAEGELEVAGSTGEFKVLQKHPNKITWEFMANGETYAQGFDGKKGWKKDPSGVQSLNPQELRAIKRLSELHAESHMKTLFPKLEYKGTETHDGERVYILESSPSAEISDRLAFSVKSGLHIGQMSRDGDTKIRNSNKEFKKVDGVLRAHLVQQTVESPEGMMEFTLRWKKMTSNVEIKDDVFQEPKN